MTPSSQTLKTVAAVAAGTTVVALAARMAIRSRSPTIHCKLCCPCKKVQGYIKCIPQDSIRIWCFCDDCREYAAFVASQDKNSCSVVGEYGESKLVQVCKSDLHITKGQELLQLSRKGPPSGKTNKGEDGKQQQSQLYMHRYYTKCCSTPLFQTVDFLGFVAVFLKNLDQKAQEQFDGPVAMFPEMATKECPETPPDIFAPNFLWKLVRYHSSRKMGPFDYDMTPTYWGKKYEELNPVKQE